MGLAPRFRQRAKTYRWQTWRMRVVSCGRRHQSRLLQCRMRQSCSSRKRTHFFVLRTPYFVLLLRSRMVRAGPNCDSGRRAKVKFQNKHPERHHLESVSAFTRYTYRRSYHPSHLSFHLRRCSMCLSPNPPPRGERLSPRAIAWRCALTPAPFSSTNRAKIPSVSSSSSSGVPNCFSLPFSNTTTLS